jgi:hypothetical protein
MNQNENGLDGQNYEKSVNVLNPCFGAFGLCYFTKLKNIALIVGCDIISLTEKT